MQTSLNTSLRSPWTYFAATFLWSWSLCGLLIFTELRSIPTLSFVMILLAMIGPGVTGILFTIFTRSRAEVRDYWHRVVDTTRLTPHWLAVAVGLPFLLHAMAGAIDALAGGAGMSLGESAPAFIANPSGQLLSLSVLTLIPFFEELGWRGYAQDVLERRRSPLRASLILGCVWSLWHLPASFIPETYQAGLGIGTREFWLHFAGIIVLSVVVSWIYINTNRSILIMVVFHAMVNLAGELISLSETGETIYTLCWVSAAAAIVLAYGRSMRVDSAIPSADQVRKMALPLIAGLGVPLGTTTLSPSVLTAQDATVPARDIATRFQSEMEVLHREYGFPGMTAAYVLPDGSTGHVAVGMADVEGRRAMTTASTMLAASVGKTFVGATVLALAEEGRLTLDDRVADWLGDRVWFERLPNHDAITLRHLLNHTSGLSNHVESARFAGYMAEEWSALNDPKPEELIAYALDQPPLFAPGDGWSYSDTGYLLLGLVVERASGRTYYQELNSRFLTPLRLENTVPSNRRELPELATGYTEADNPFGLPTRTTTRFGIMAWHPGIEWTGGGLASTPLDLVRWARALFEGEALAGTYLDEMLAFVPLDEVGRAGYGLGVAVRRDDVLGTNVGHGGWIPGYCTSLRYYTDHGVGIALQINTDVGMMEGSPTPVDRIEARLARVVIEANRAESRPPTSGSP